RVELVLEQRVVHRRPERRHHHEDAIAVDQLGAGLHRARHLVLGVLSISRILRPWIPPLSLISSKRIFTAFDDDTPYVAAGPDRSVCIPSTISVLLTPRLSCASATPASAPAASTTPA